MQFRHPEILYFLLFLLIVPIWFTYFSFVVLKEYFTNVRFLKALSVQTRKVQKKKKWLLLSSRLLYSNLYYSCVCTTLLKVDEKTQLMNCTSFRQPRSACRQRKKRELLKGLSKNYSKIPRKHKFFFTQAI
jgi:hypothetical protein